MCYIMCGCLRVHGSLRIYGEHNASVRGRRGECGMMENRIRCRDEVWACSEENCATEKSHAAGQCANVCGDSSINESRWGVRSDKLEQWRSKAMASEGKHRRSQKSQCNCNRV